MRFNNDDYLAAFPREERAAAQSTPAQTPAQDQPGSVTEEADKITNKNQAPASDSAPASDQTSGDLGGDENGNE